MSEEPLHGSYRGTSLVRNTPPEDPTVGLCLGFYPPNTTIAHILLNYPHGAQAFLTVEGNPGCRYPPRKADNVPPLGCNLSSTSACIRAAPSRDHSY